jgi:amino acid transporter
MKTKAENIDPKAVPHKQRTFGTFAGVFTPTTLTILGVIMYIRQPWVVGNAGIVGAILIISLAIIITFTTGLSLSSITTNIRIGSGGAFSLISQSLGLEIGGAIGIPFYFSQAVAVAMYIFGFREGVNSIFPEMSPLILDACIFVVVMGIAFISTSFAFKIQYVIMGIIVLSLVSIYGALFVKDLNFDFQWMGTYPGSPDNNFGGSSFWIVFAVFFPAVSGVMAGANMSGDLSNPRRNIPIGTLSAVLVTTVIYLSLVFVAALLATPDELVSNYNVFIDKSLFPPIVLAGLLGATLSSALGSFVGAPRILLALGEKRILPKSDFLAKTTKRGEPWNAMLITAVIVVFGLSLRNLNTIAPLITMFFMITYGMVNVVALIEQSLGLPSFRPSLKIPKIVPIIGAMGSITVMFIINAFVALVSVILIIVFYFYLVKKQIKSEAGDSRSGLFTALAEWATKKTNELSPKREVRSWRPDLLIPVTAPRDVRSSFKLVESIVYPKGSIKLLAVPDKETTEHDRMVSFIPTVVKRFKDINIPTSYSVVNSNDFVDTVKISMQSLNAAFFKPNALFVALDSDKERNETFKKIIQEIKDYNFGIILYVPFSTIGLALEKNINLWLIDFPKNWNVKFDIGNNDLSLLISILIRRNWNGNINLIVLNTPDNEAPFTYDDYLLLGETIRLPKDSTTIEFLNSSFDAAISRVKHADVNIFSLSEHVTFDRMFSIVNTTRISAVFCSDSGYESALV